MDMCRLIPITSYLIAGKKTLRQVMLTCGSTPYLSQSPSFAGIEWSEDRLDPMSLPFPFSEACIFFITR